MPVVLPTGVVAGFLALVVAIGNASAPCSAKENQGTARCDAQGYALHTSANRH